MKVKQCPFIARAEAGFEWYQAGWSNSFATSCLWSVALGNSNKRYTDRSLWAGEWEMERFLGLVKQIRRSRRRKGKKYRPEEDYHEGYEDVYYYASEHFPSKDCTNVLLLLLWQRGLLLFSALKKALQPVFLFRCIEGGGVFCVRLLYCMNERKALKKGLIFQVQLIDFYCARLLLNHSSA